MIRVLETSEPHAPRAAAAAQPPMDEIVEGQMPVPMPSTANMPTASLEHQINRLAYGEVEAPEDVDTLRNEDEDDTDDFKHYVESPKELRGPDLDQTKQLDREQEQEGLDVDRRAEDVEDVGGAPVPGRMSTRPLTPKEARAMARKHYNPSVLVDARTGRRYYAAEGDDFDPAGGPPPPDAGGLPPGGGDDGPPPPDGGAPSGASEEELLAEAEHDLQMAEANQDDDFSGDPGSDAGGSDDDYSDDPDAGGPPHDGDVDGGPFDDNTGGEGDGDLPPWLADGGPGPDTDPAPPPPHDREGRRRRAVEEIGPDDPRYREHKMRQYDWEKSQTQGPRTGEPTGDGKLFGYGGNGKHGSSTQNKRRAQKGQPMSLSARGRVASAGRRTHYAESNSGYTDGGPYHTDDNDQGEQEEIFISDTPSAEAVAAPRPGDSPDLQHGEQLGGGQVARIQRRNAELKRDLIAYEQITGRRIGNRRYAERQPAQPAGAVQSRGTETPDEVDPTVHDRPGAEKLTGDNFDSVALDSGAETQPKDASRHAFRPSTTGCSGPPDALRASTATPPSSVVQRPGSARAPGVVSESLFPTLGTVLREARKNEREGQPCRRRADEKLEVAAPQDRIDVEAPVRDTTDARGAGFSVRSR